MGLGNVAQRIGWAESQSKIFEMRILASEVTNSHVRAHWVEAGTWIDLYLSVTSRQPRDESRAVLLEMLKSLRVKEKG